MKRKHGISVRLCATTLLSDYGTAFSPEDLAPYSIDECFIRLSGYSAVLDIERYCLDGIQTIEKWLRLPCSIGISRNKTQAKLANYFAKKRRGFQSVCNLLKLNLCSPEQRLMETSAAEIGGIERKTGKKLAGCHIQNAYDLTFANAHHPARQFPSLTALAIRELNGQSCIALDDPELPHQQLLSSRRFPTTLCDKSIIKQAVIFHLNRAHKRLTAQRLLYAIVHVPLY